MTSSIARMNCFLHGIEDFQIVRGDTLSQPKFVEGDRLMQFDVCLANPPCSIKQWDRQAFGSDPWGRNLYGTPPQGRADYAFWQHILMSLAPKTGRCAILFPHGVLFRQEEAQMRRKLIEADLIDCVLGLGPNLFYNSPMEACIVVCRTAKPRERKNRILFINAVNEVTRERAQSFLTDEHIERIVAAYRRYENEPGTGETYVTAAGIVLLARDPSMVFPQCRILADAYRSTEPDGDPRDHEDIRIPMPLAVDRAIAFIDRNTRHPMRIIGLNRIRLDEYPVDGLREAIVNAVAHRQYEDGGRKIILEVFSDRVVVSSPGLPPAPITLAGLRKGRYRPCSRNPVLAQCLSYFHRIEERGSGFRRMRDQMLNHGLDQPLIGTDTGYFQVIFPGPGENIERIRVPETRLLVTPAVEAQLNERQKRIVRQALEDGFVTAGWCMKNLQVVRDTAHRDLTALVKLGILVAKGAGRGARYVFMEGIPNV